MKYKEFMKEKALKAEIESYVASKRFTDENGEPMVWEIRNFSAKEDEEIVKKCLKMGDNGLVVDKKKCLALAMAKSVVYPNLDDEELQNYYGVSTSEDLLKVMLTSLEYYKLQRRICLIGIDLDEEIKTSVTEKAFMVDETEEELIV